MFTVNDCGAASLAESTVEAKVMSPPAVSTSTVSCGSVPVPLYVWPPPVVLTLGCASVLLDTFHNTASLIVTVPAFTPPLLAPAVDASMLNCALPPRLPASESVVRLVNAVVFPTSLLNTSLPVVLTVKAKPPSTVPLNVTFPPAVSVSTVS